MQTVLSTIATALCFAATSFFQSATRPDKPLPKPVARISYMTGKIVDLRTQQGTPKFCFALYSDGLYRMSRLSPQDTMEGVQGTLSADQLTTFEKLLDGVTFHSSGGGVVQQGAQTFVAEIFRDRKPDRFSWVNPDHRRPLPHSAEAVVKWLQTFKDPGEGPINVPDLTTNPICPTVVPNPVPLTR